ncbi:hypothetical protein [Mesorhizobium sp. M1374]|uniref:hypothetical protein n=1 Tax=Mesorhizobium sp. M1374 TaxID=2957091 RepID=UPI00333A639E
MWWIIGIGLTAILLYPFFRNSTKRPQKLMPRHSQEVRMRGESLPENEQKSMGNEIRELVSTEYEVGYSTAKKAGKDELFCRHLGTYRVIAHYLSKTIKNVDEQSIQEECMPFREIEPDTAKAAISEYVVWKFFSNEAVDDILRPVLQSYKNFLLSEAGKLEGKRAGKFLFDAIYCEKHDWQRYIAALPSETK